MKRPSTVSQIVRFFVTAAALAVGAMGCAGSDSTGTAGSGGGGGGGAGGATSCDAMPLFTKHTCMVVGACHDAQGTAAGFDMVTAGWETHLVGKVSPGGGASTTPSLCGNMGHVYLQPITIPAVGLFMDKLTKAPPECGVQMPNLPPLMTAAEIATVQCWANGLVNAAH